MKFLRVPLLGVALALVSFAMVQAQQPQPAPGAPRTVLLPDKPELEPKALDILKAASSKLAAARTLTFTAVTTYESAARTLQPLAYMVRSDVTLERPDKLRVITPGDGPANEFYYNGKQMMAFEPAAGLVAIADAPPTIDEMLKMAYQKAAITFPFEDMLLADPYKGLGPDLRLAFYMGQSRIVGGILTDMVGLATGLAQGQVWIGAEDKLPRLIRITYFNEPGNYRHVVEFSNWQLDGVLPPGTFESARASAAKRIAFSAPDEKPKQK